MQRIIQWLGKERQAKRRVAAIAGAYAAWLAAEHPRVHRAQRDAIAGLAEARDERELAARIAYLDRQVARAA